ncbi:MAG TPA: ABC transporter substrate-binding protein [Candidatus Binatia bacterium]|jgi:NitT/TauT family transport system substrate-binding protein
MTSVRSIVALSLALLFASVLSNQARSFAGDKIKIALTTVGGSFLAGGVAAKKGFFQREGLDVELVQVNVAVALTALLSGDIDYTLLFGSTVRAAVRGMPVKVLASFMDAPTQSLVARENIKSVAELKGKKVVVSSFGASAHVTTVLILHHFGITPGEVSFVAGGPDRARLAMLEQGLADAAILNPFAIVRAEKLGFRVIARAYELFSFPNYGFGATDKKIREQRDVTKRALKALIRANQYIRENGEGTIQVLMDWAKVDRETATADYNTIRLISSSDGTIPEKGLRLWIDESRAALKTEREIPLGEVADFSVLSEVQKELKLTRK